MNKPVLTFEPEQIRTWIESYANYLDWQMWKKETGLNRDDFLKAVKKLYAFPNGKIKVDINNQTIEITANSEFPEPYLYEELELKHR